MASGGNSGVTGGDQMSFEQQEAEKIAAGNEKKVAADKANPDFDKYPKSIHDGRQGKHIPGHNNYTPGRSKITIPKDQLQSLIIAHSNKGQAISGNKERIDFGTVIGVYVDQSTGKEYPTTIGIINYSKDGTHVVPARPKGGK